MDLPGQVLREAHLAQIGVQATVVERVFLSSIPPSWLRGDHAMQCLERGGMGMRKALLNILELEPSPYFLLRLIIVSWSDLFCYSSYRAQPTLYLKEERILTKTDIHISL